MRVAHGSCVLVADGRKLLFFRNEGDATNVHLKVETAQEHPNPADRDQKTDAAGGASSPQGASRSSMAETDFHQLEEDRFAAEAADMINKRSLRGDFEALIIVAPPKTLGELRKHYHKEADKRIVGEIAKDLTGHPVAAIEKALDAAE